MTVHVSPGHPWQPSVLPGPNLLPLGAPSPFLHIFQTTGGRRERFWHGRMCRAQEQTRARLSCSKRSDDSVDSALNVQQRGTGPPCRCWHSLEEMNILQLMNSSLLKCKCIKRALPTPTLIELYFTEFQNRIYSGHLKLFSEPQF